MPFVKIRISGISRAYSHACHVSYFTSKERLVFIALSETCLLYEICIKLHVLSYRLSSFLFGCSVHDSSTWLASRLKENIWIGHKLDRIFNIQYKWQDIM
jgi:hypothetical protein